MAKDRNLEWATASDLMPKQDPPRFVVSHDGTIEDVEYRDIRGWPGYRIGNNGIVWSCRKFGGGIARSWHALKLCFHKHGYPQAGLVRRGDDGKRRHRTECIHRLLLFAFVGPCPEGMECRHLDGDPTNCRLSNLAWGTHKENMEDKKRHGTERHLRGEPHPKSRLTEDDVRRIFDLDALGLMGKEIGERFNMSAKVINAILNGKSWKHLGLKRRAAPPDLAARKRRRPHTPRKLTADQVFEIRRLAAEGLSQAALGERFGVHKGTIGQIVHRKIWKDAGLPASTPATSLQHAGEAR